MLRRRQHPQRKDRLAVLGGLIVLVAGAITYVSYTALEGLPWQDAYEVSVEVPNANRLIATNEVRIGGVRVGQVTDVAAIPAAGGSRPRARVDLALDPGLEELPADTVVRVRPSSVLGATFVDLEPGAEARTVPAGGTIPLSSVRETVELSDLFKAFDESTRRSFEEAVGGFAGGFAGRGAAFNSLIGSLNELLPSFTVVATALADPDTRLASFVSSYEATFVALGRVSAELGGLVSGGAATFAAMAREARALGAMLDAGPGAERAATVAFTRARPALDGLAELAGYLEPASRLLPAALHEMNQTLATGTKPMLLASPFAGRLGASFAALEDLNQDATTEGSLRKLDELAVATNEVLEVLLPAQIHCNSIGLYNNFSSGFAALGTGHGPALPKLIITTLGAENELLQNSRPSPDIGINPLPNQNEHECEAGNEPTPSMGNPVLNNPPGLQSSTTRDTEPPPGVRKLAREAGLLKSPEGAP